MYVEGLVRAVLGSYVDDFGGDDDDGVGRVGGVCVFDSAYGYADACADDFLDLHLFILDFACEFRCICTNLALL